MLPNLCSSTLGAARCGSASLGVPAGRYGCSSAQRGAGLQLAVGMERGRGVRRYLCLREELEGTAAARGSLRHLAGEKPPVR